MKPLSKHASRLGLLLLLVLITSVGAIAQTLEENAANADFGIVYFIRGKGNAGSARAFSAIIDEKRVCKLNNRRYSRHQVAPGRHAFKAQFGGKKGKKNAEVAEIDVEAGGTYYIQMVLQESFATVDVIAQEITRNSALRLVEDDKVKEDKKCKGK